MNKLWPVKIIGMGRYLPKRVVPSAEVERRAGLEPGYALKRSGVDERRWATPEEGETASWMGAQAALQALAEADMEPRELDLILNASGSPERCIPDGGPLIQRHLGLGQSGIPALSVHATCLSFIAAFEVAAERLTSGRIDSALIVSSDIASVGLNFADPETCTLFGDGAAAVVLKRTPEGEHSAVHTLHFETYGEGADLTTIPGGGTSRPPYAEGSDPEDALFHMDGPRVMEMAIRHAPGFLQRLGLVGRLGDVGCVVAHQTSKAGLKALEHLGFPRQRVVRTLERLGNCIAASLPLTLYQAVHHRDLKRGDLCLMLGTGAGLSIGGMLFTY